MGSRKFIAPFDMYEALMGRNAEIKGEHERNIPPMGDEIKDKEVGKEPP